MSWLGSWGDDDAPDDAGTADEASAGEPEEEYLTDLDRALLRGDDPRDREVTLEPADFTDLDDAALSFHRTEDLSDRYGATGLAAITCIHFLPAAVGLLPVLFERVPGSMALATTALAPSVGFDLFFLTGLVAFTSGAAGHLAREYGSRYFLRYALAALLGGSGVYLLAVVNAAVLPGTYLTSGGFTVGRFPELNAGVVALSVVGGLLVLTRLARERLVAD